jgi:hypothetical protein
LDTERIWLDEILQASMDYLSLVVRGETSPDVHRINVCVDTINRACGKPVSRHELSSVTLHITAEQLIDLQRAADRELLEFEAALIDGEASDTGAAGAGPEAKLLSSPAAAAAPGPPAKSIRWDEYEAYLRDELERLKDGPKQGQAMISRRPQITGER